MGRLNLQQTFSAELAKRRFLLRPAEPSAYELMGQSPDGILLGKTQLMNIPVFWDYRRLANPHIAVLGMTGSGKSYLIKTFITRAYRQWRTSTLILDWSGEYTSWVRAAGGKIVALGEHDSINLLDCRVDRKKDKKRSSLTPRKRIDQFLNTLSILTDLDRFSRQKRITEDALKKSFEKKGLDLDKPISNKTHKKKLPTLFDALKILDTKKTNDEDIQASHQRLERFCSKGFDYFARPGLAVDSLMDSGLISIDLSSLPSENHRSMAGLTILQFIKERMRIEGLSKDEHIKLFVVADEAWKIAQDERSDLIAILREGRKYNFSLIVASQDPTDLSNTVLSNAASLFVFRLMHSEFREKILNSMNMDRQASIDLEKFSVGCPLTRFAFRTPGQYDGPFVISRILGEPSDKKMVIMVKKMKLSFENNDLKKKLYRAGCSDSQIQILIKEFEKNDYNLPIEKIASLLLSFGFSKTSMLNLFRDLSIPDPDIASIFDKIQAKRYSLEKKKISELVIDDEKA